MDRCIENIEQFICYGVLFFFPVAVHKLYVIYITEGTFRGNVFMMFCVLIFGIIVRDGEVIITSDLSWH